jgi:hypothetical protein
MRRCLVAMVFCLTAWIVVAAVQPSANAAPSAGAVPTAEAQAPDGAGHSDSRWVAGQRAFFSVTESLWKSSVLHADLAAVLARETFVAIDASVRPPKFANHRSVHLRHVPLLN